MMEYLILAISILSLIITIAVLIAVSKRRDNSANIERLCRDLFSKTEESISRLRLELITSTQASLKNMGDMLEANQKNRHETGQNSLEAILISIFERQNLKMDDMNKQIATYSIDAQQQLDTIRNILKEGLENLRSESAKQLTSARQELDARLSGGLNDLGSGLETRLKAATESIDSRLENINKSLLNFSTQSEQKLENIRMTVERSLREMREDNNRKLDEMRQTVDEKLQTELERRIKESFNTVSGMLERVQKDIGSMRTLAEDVGGLKKTLSNVKTRGMMGEFQLESILNDVFSHDQYIKNAHPDPESQSVVEFALKIPTDDGAFMLLPIDSKFPRDRYEAVVQASDNADKAALDRAVNAYILELKRAAKDIHDKYIVPPYTTDFALLFLPTESMYADAINRNMLQEIWRMYKVYITGPSTISALLSSMQLAFNNMAIQKRAGEVFSVLSEVQSEFSKFEVVLQKMQKHLNSANEDLSSLMGVRSRKITNRLNSIAKLSTSDELDHKALPAILE